MSNSTVTDLPRINSPQPRDVQETTLVCLIKVGTIFAAGLQGLSLFTFQRGQKQGKLKAPIDLYWKLYAGADVAFALGMFLRAEGLAGRKGYVPNVWLQFGLFFSGWYAGILLQLGIAVYRCIAMGSPGYYLKNNNTPGFRRIATLAAVSCVAIGILISIPATPLPCFGVNFAPTTRRIRFYATWGILSVSGSMYVGLLLSKMWQNFRYEPNQSQPGSPYHSSRSRRSASAVSGPRIHERHVRAQKRMFAVSFFSWFLSLAPSIIFIETSNPIRKIAGIFCLWLAASSTPVLHLAANTEYRKLVVALFSDTLGLKRSRKIETGSVIFSTTHAY